MVLPELFMFKMLDHLNFLALFDTLLMKMHKLDDLTLYLVSNGAVAL